VVGDPIGRSEPEPTATGERVAAPDARADLYSEARAARCALERLIVRQARARSRLERAARTGAATWTPRLRSRQVELSAKLSAARLLVARSELAELQGRLAVARTAYGVARLTSPGAGPDRASLDARRRRATGSGLIRLQAESAELRRVIDALVDGAAPGRGGASGA
jgi:hypothetical protein